MTWTDDLKRVPLPRLVIGTVVGWLLTGLILLWLRTVPAFDERARIAIEGEVQQVGAPRVMNQPVLDFALRNQTSRFRVDSGVFDEALNRQIPAALHAGAAARLEVDEAEYKDPFSPEPYRVPTVTVDAIRIGSEDVLTLAASRAWSDENRRWAKRLAPIFGACALFLSLMLMLALRVRAR